MIVGRNAAARELGISPQALGKAAKTGRVVCTPEGQYDVEACREQLKRNSNPIKQASARAQKQAAASKPRHARRAEPVAPAPSDEESGTEESALSDYRDQLGDDVREITLQRERLKLKKELREFRLQGKRLVDGRKVKAETVERAANVRQALLNIPKRWSQSLAARLGVEDRKIQGALSGLVRELLLELSSVSVGAAPERSPESVFPPGGMPPPSPVQMSGVHA